MSKTFKLILVSSLFILQSCSVLIKKQVPLSDVNKEPFIIEQPMSHPTDSTKQIIVYNVIESKGEKKLISDETIRLFIADLFGTVTTILTLRQLDTTP